MQKTKTENASPQKQIIRSQNETANKIQEIAMKTM